MQIRRLAEVAQAQLPVVRQHRRQRLDDLPVLYELAEAEEGAAAAEATADGVELALVGGHRRRLRTRGRGEAWDPVAAVRRWRGWNARGQHP